MTALVLASEVRVGDRITRMGFYDGIVTALPEWETVEDMNGPVLVGTITLDTFGMFVSADDEIRVTR